MSDGALVQLVNTRKAVGRDACYSGVLGAAQLVDFAGVVEAGSGPAVKAELRFGRDDDDRPVLDVKLVAQVKLECQRCLEYFRTEMRSNSRLGIVISDEQARQLPAAYEPLISGEETDLWAVVAEELALALPVVAYHPEGECGVDLSGADCRDVPSGAQQGSRANPFNVLSALLDQPGAGADEKE